MEFIYSTGGREKYFTRLSCNDCVCRAIANATNKDYKEVYDGLMSFAKLERKSKFKHTQISTTGVRRTTAKKYLESIGWKFISTCKVGQGVSLHLTENELPMGTLIVDISKHFTCVKDRVIYDTYNCSIKTYYDEFGNKVVNNKRAVYGYFVKMSEEELKVKEEQNKQAQLSKEIDERNIAEMKMKVKAINDKYHKELMNYINKEKLYHHKRILLENKIKREIANMKKQEGDKFCDKVLNNEVNI